MTNATFHSGARAATISRRSPTCWPTIHWGASAKWSRIPPDPAYVAAFEAIDSDPNQLLAVGALADGTVAGCLQITFIPGLSHRGQWRGQIESVRVAEAARGRGAGRRMLEWAIAACAERGCGIVQLTSDKTRGDAIRFYEQLGFVASHEGLKLKL